MFRAGLSLADGLDSISQVNIRELHQPPQQAGWYGLYEQLPAPRQVHHEHHHGRERQGGESTHLMSIYSHDIRIINTQTKAH